MKTKRAKHNLSRLKMSCVAGIWEKGKQRYERELELATSRPSVVDFPYSAGKPSNTQEA